MGSELVHGAWHDLEQRLVSGLGLQPKAGPAQAGPCPGLWRRWSGALLLWMPWWSAQLRVLVSGDEVERLLSPSGRPATRRAPRSVLVALAQATSTRTIRVEVQLEPFELDVGALTSMRVGDVLRTSHGLERPLLLGVGTAGTEGAVEWAGLLGRAGSNRAVEIVGERGATP